MGIRLKRKFNHLKRMNGQVGPAVSIVLEAWATDTMINWQNKMMTSPPTGRTYYSRTRPSPHTASSPGNPPRVWTSEYLDSIRVKSTTALKGPIYRWQVTTDAPHAGELEFVLNRPVILPTAAEAPGRVGKFADAFGKHLI